jgi:hypothetical protein
LNSRNFIGPVVEQPDGRRVRVANDLNVTDYRPAGRKCVLREFLLRDRALLFAMR